MRQHAEHAYVFGSAAESVMTGMKAVLLACKIIDAVRRQQGSKTIRSALNNIKYHLVQSGYRLSMPQQRLRRHQHQRSTIWGLHLIQTITHRARGVRRSMNLIQVHGAVTNLSSNEMEVVCRCRHIG